MKKLLILILFSLMANLGYAEEFTTTLNISSQFVDVVDDGFGNRSQYLIIKKSESFFVTYLENRWHYKTKSNGNKYSTLKMLKKYWIWDNNNFVEYFNEKMRKKYKVKIINGKLCDSKGRVLHSDMFREILFAMDEDGNIYAGYKYNGSNIERIFHSSFLAGNIASSAGRLEVRNGKIEAVINDSGHYQFAFNQFIQIIDELGRRKYNFDGVYVKDIANATIDLTITTTPQGIKVEDLYWQQKELNAC
jgi:hypothetical protein